MAGSKKGKAGLRTGDWTVDLFDHLREFKRRPGPSIEKVPDAHSIVYRTRRRYRACPQNTMGSGGASCPMGPLFSSPLFGSEETPIGTSLLRPVVIVPSVRALNDRSTGC